jgi:TonB family protein
MKSRYRPLMFVVVAVCLPAVVEHASAQSPQSAEAQQSGAVLTKLADPTYPPLARQAGIVGDVDLMLTIRRDGSVESAVVVSRHPMLKQAALESAQGSQFECGGCGEVVTPYALKYRFQITSRGYPKDCDYTEKQPPAEVDLPHHQVTVSAWAMEICDPASQIIKVRSAKCLYLWRCGTRDED